MRDEKYEELLDKIGALINAEREGIASDDYEIHKAAFERSQKFYNAWFVVEELTK